MIMKNGWYLYYRHHDKHKIINTFTTVVFDNCQLDLNIQHMFKSDTWLGLYPEASTRAFKNKSDQNFFSLNIFAVNNLPLT